MCVIGNDVCRDVGDYLVGSRKGSDHLSGYSTGYLLSALTIFIQEYKGLEGSIIMAAISVAILLSRLYKITTASFK